MFNEIFKKFVVLSMKNGTILEGFVEEIENGCARLFEIDNNIVVLDMSEIAFARIAGNAGSKKRVEPEAPVAYNQQNSERPQFRPKIEDFSMSLPTADGNVKEVPYRKPTFLRETQRDIEK